MAIRVIKGVAPLNIPASAEETRVSANAKSIQGIDTHRRLTMKRYFHAHFGGRGVLVTRLKTTRVAAPKAIRVKATPTGVNASRPTIIK